MPSISNRKARCCLSALVIQVLLQLPAVSQSRHAEIQIDTTKIENGIPSQLYGQFVEDLFGGVEGPLFDELVRNRSFEEPPNEIGLSRF